MKAQIPKDKWFYIQTKEEMVEAMKNPVIAACKLLIDRLIDNIDLEGFDLKEKKEDEPEHIQTARDAVERYQKIIDKLNNKEELTTEEFDSIALICKTVSIIFENHAKSSREASQELSKISWKIVHLDLASDKMENVLGESKNLT